MKMSADDLVLALQRAIDRFIRRLRRGGPPHAHAPAAADRPDRRPVASVLEHGAGVEAHAFPQTLAGAPRLPDGADVGRPAHLDTRVPDGGVLRRASRHPGLPLLQPRARRQTFTSRGPDTRRGSRRRHASGRRGILQGGSAYGCCFTGGADNNFFTFTSLTKPSGRGVLSALSPFVVVAWVAAKNLALTVYELAKAVPRFIAHPGRCEPRLALALDEDLHVDLGAQFLHDGGVARSLRGRAGHLRQLPRTTTRWRMPSVRAAGARCRPCAEWIVRSSSSGASCGACPSTATTPTSWPTTASPPARPTGDLTQGQRLERWIFDEFLHPERAGEPDAAAHRPAARTPRAPGRDQGHDPAVHELPRRGLSSAAPTPKPTSRTACGRFRRGPTRSSTCWTRRTPLDADCHRAALPGPCREAVAQPRHRLRACALGKRRMARVLLAGTALRVERGGSRARSPAARTPRSCCRASPT